MITELSRQHSLEKELILICSQTRLNPQQIERVNDILRQSPDWTFISNVISRNGLLPLVCWNLLKKFADALHAKTRLEVSQAFQEHTQRNLFLTQKLIETVRILEEAGIPALPFKGPTLAMQTYGNLALRQYADLDILVQPKHFDEAVKVLSKKEFEPTAKINWLKRNILFFNNKKDIVLVGQDKIVRVELHWKLSGAHFAMPVEINDLWNRLEKLNLGGTKLNALPFKDLFVFLCLHGSRHAWERLAWLSDLHELILITESSGKEIDWVEIQQHAKNLGCEKVVELGLFLVYKFFNLTTNYPDFGQIQNNPTYEKIAGQVKRKLFAKEIKSSEISDWYLYHLSLKERKADRFKLHLRYIFWYLKIIFRPNSMDKSVFHLPDILYPLYYILRPARLLFNRFTPNSKKITSD